MSSGSDSECVVQSNDEEVFEACENPISHQSTTSPPLATARPAAGGGPGDPYPPITTLRALAEHSGCSGGPSQRDEANNQLGRWTLDGWIARVM
jgi:hypothetical protein